MKKLFLIFLMLCAHAAFASGIGTTATAPCDNDTLSKYSGTANVEINWEPNVIQLGWYDGTTPVAGPETCTYNGTISVPQTPPARPGYTFNGWKVMGVPNGYTRLDYLKSVGAQCIDTGILLSSNDVIYEWEAKDNDEPTGSKNTLFGAQGALNGYTTWSGLLWEFNTFRTACVGTSSWNSDYVSDDGLFHQWKWVINSNHTAYLVKDGDILSTHAWNGDLYNQHNIMLFGNSTAGAPYECSNLELRYFKITDNGNLVFHGIPARRNSDGVLGIYDTVSKSFKTNSCSGSFVAGPAVQ